ncbi:ImmA/IrrE family metallo-endopeptidase [Chromobacterium piscinae]|uniref:ImmA/IrrE family metallo-endopeptidase n=1 Tax=Chromobacterium piscinae TaxID=686831 RepID=UPI00320A4F31
MSQGSIKLKKKPTGCRVNPVSTEAVRKIAMVFRGLLDLGLERFDPLRLMDELAEYDVEFIILEDDQFPETDEALCIPEDRCIVFPMRTFTKLANGDGRALFTFAHELGHLVLQHRVVLSRGVVEHEFFEDSEWQANCFAAEFLMPLEAIRSKQLLTKQQLIAEYGVSYKAATKRLSILREKNEI